MDAEITFKLRRRVAVRGIKRFCEKHNLKLPLGKFQIKNAPKVIANNLSIVTALKKYHDPNLNEAEAVKLFLGVNAKIQAIVDNPEKMYAETGGYISV